MPAPSKRSKALTPWPRNSRSIFETEKKMKQHVGIPPNVCNSF
jgi:hypothetical protein